MKNLDNTTAPILPFQLTKSTDTVPWSSTEWSSTEAETGKEEMLSLRIKVADWQKAKPGRYKGRIIFTASIEE